LLLRLVLRIAIVAFLANLLAAAAAPPPLDAARARCLEEGWRPQDLKILGWKETQWFGFHRQGSVDYRARGQRGTKVIHVGLHSPHGFVDWRAAEYSERDAPAD
jgi:hypothetical protein